MNIPPIKIFLQDVRKPIYLIAFIEYQKVMPDKPSADCSNWFIGFYVLPYSEVSKYFLVLVNSEEGKVRFLKEAGDSFEYSVILFSGFYENVSVLDLSCFAHYLDRDLFKGKLSKGLFAYRKELFKIEKRFENLRRDYWNAKHH